jgi:nucleotide-binding universal stress UspA family protein
MRRILVPLDGSCFGEAALPLAAATARRDGTGLELVTVHGAFPYPDVALDAAVELDRTLRARETAYLEDVAERVRRGFEIPVTSTVLDGPTVPAILQYTRAHPPGLIVMSTHGRTGASRYFLGSTADRLVRELHCPFLLVRPGARPAEVEQPAVARQVLVALDGSAAAETVIEEVVRFFSPTTTAILLFRVVVPIEVFPVGLPIPFPPVHPEVLEDQVADARQYLHAVAARLRQRGWRVHPEVVVEGSPGAALVAYAERQHCDLIALATRGLGGVKRALFGSVADKVIRGAATPVLVVNPPSVVGTMKATAAMEAQR